MLHGFWCKMQLKSQCCQNLRLETWHVKLYKLNNHLGSNMGLIHAENNKTLFLILKNKAIFFLT